MSLKCEKPVSKFAFSKCKLCRYSLGSAQAFGRALFSELIPEGHEADMFALFEITDKVGRCKLNSVEP